MLDAGADQALVRGASIEAGLGENAVDVVIDLVGGGDWPELLTILRPLAVMRSPAPSLAYCGARPENALFKRSAVCGMHRVR